MIRNNRLNLLENIYGIVINKKYEWIIQFHFLEPRNMSYFPEEHPP